MERYLDQVSAMFQLEGLQQNSIPHGECQPQLRGRTDLIVDYSLWVHWLTGCHRDRCRNLLIGGRGLDVIWYHVLLLGG